MTDSELIALAAMAQIEAVLMHGDNDWRKLNGELPIWSTSYGLMPFGCALNKELIKRGILHDDRSEVAWRREPPRNQTPRWEAAHPGAAINHELTKERKMKIVINKCYGGFNLSHEAVLLYGKLKGIELYAFTNAKKEDG